MSKEERRGKREKETEKRDHHRNASRPKREGRNGMEGTGDGHKGVLSLLCESKTEPENESKRERETRVWVVEGRVKRHSLSHRARAMSGARSLVFCLRCDATSTPTPLPSQPSNPNSRSLSISVSYTPALNRESRTTPNGWNAFLSLFRSGDDGFQGEREVETVKGGVTLTNKPSASRRTGRLLDAG